MADENAAAQLEKLSANPRELLVGGNVKETVRVRPLKFLELIRSTKHLVPILESLDKVTDAEGVSGVKELLLTAPEAMLEIAVICTDKPKEWFATLEADDGFEVFIAVYEVNHDFFVQRLGPKLARFRQAPAESTKT